MLHSDWLKYFKLWFRRNYRYKRFKWRRFRIWTVKFEQILNFYHFFPKYWPPRAVKSHYSSTLLNRTRWFRWISQWWTVHFDTLIYSEGPSTFSRKTVYFDPWPSTLAQKTVHYRPGPSTLAQMTVQFGSKFFENFHQKCLSLKCSDLLGAGSGRPLIWFKRCANVEALILDRSLDAARCSPVRNRYVSDKNSDFDENHKFFSKIFFFKILLPKVHTYYTDHF